MNCIITQFRAEFEVEEEKLSISQADFTELSDQFNEMKSSPSSAVLSKFLQTKIKAQKLRLREMDSLYEGLNKELSGLKQQLSSNQDGSSSAADPQQKLSMLIKKDKELSAFIDEFDESKSKMSAEIDKFNRRNVLLLQFGSKEIVSKMSNSTSVSRINRLLI